MGAALEESVTGTTCSDGTNRQIDRGLTADITELTPKITAPTLVIGCTHDQLVPLEHSRHLHESIEPATWSSTAGTSSSPDAPEELVIAMRGFPHAEN